MIQVFSGEFKVKPEEENTLVWFITEVCQLNLHGGYFESPLTYSFTGVSEGYLTGFAIDKEEATRLGITEEEYSELEEELVVVDFSNVLSKIVDGYITYYEVESNIDSIYRTTVSESSFQFDQGFMDFKSGDSTYTWHELPPKGG